MAPLRIAVGRLWQESNDLSTAPTTADDWRANAVLHGGEIAALAGSRAAELGGFVDELLKWEGGGAELVPLAGAWCFPKGRLTAECFEWLQAEILDPLREAAADGAQGVDGVLLCLHGALVAEGQNDAEGQLLAAVREVIGPNVPLVATLDLHCHITDQMLRSADAFAVYHTYPHVDMYETGVRGAEILRAILQDGAAPISALVRIPLVVPPERANTQATPEEVAADSYSEWPPQFLRRARELEAEPWCLSVAVAMTQPWLRVDRFGSSVLVTARDESGLTAARQAAEELARGFWNARESFLPRGDSILPHAAAVAEAARHAEESGGLVVIGDGADATTSGAPGDSTQLLREVMQHDWPAPALVALNSPPGVAAATVAGVGSTVTMTVGGVMDHVWCEPLQITGVVERLFHAEFTIGQDHMAGMAFDMGDACTIALRGGTKLVLNSQHGAQFAGKCVCVRVCMRVWVSSVLFSPECMRHCCVVLLVG
jgi:microcystin degradation protein MlrC